MHIFLPVQRTVLVKYYFYLSTKNGVVNTRYIIVKVYIFLLCKRQIMAV